MNGALPQLLDALGFEVWPFGNGGAWIATGYKPGYQQTGR